MTITVPFTCALLSVILISGCGERPAAAQLEYDGAQAESRASVSESLFSSDTAVIGNEALEKILDGVITLKDKAKVAVLPMGRWNADDAGTAGANIDLLRDLLSDRRVVSVTRIPSILLPQDKISIPYIREACARLQCDLVLIYTVQCRITYDSNVFRKDRATSHATIEAVAIDVRTGIVPWTDIADHDLVIEEGAANDRQLWEQARLASVTKGIAQIGGDFNVFLTHLQ